MSFSLRSIAFRLVLLALATVVGLGGVEGLVRVGGFDRPIVWEPDPLLGWKHVPGARRHWTEEGDGQIQVNSLGMRDVDRTEVRSTPDIFRVAIFGDSMTEGVQVNLDQTYTQQLESRLRARGLNVEILNFGVNGYSPLQEYLLYKNVGVRFTPDLVIEAVFLDNDIADGHPALATNQTGAPVLRPGDGLPLNVDFGGAEHSSRDYHAQPIATVRRISALYRFAGGFRAARNNGAAATGASGGVPKRYGLYEQPLTAPWGDAWARFERIATAFGQQARDSGSQFALLSVPAGQVINEEAWLGLLRDNAPMHERRWDLRAPEAHLADLATRNGLPLIATGDDYRRLPDRDGLFFGRVGHFTPSGHVAMAALLESWLLKHVFAGR